MRQRRSTGLPSTSRPRRVISGSLPMNAPTPDTQQGVTDSGRRARRSLSTAPVMRGGYQVDDTGYPIESNDVVRDARRWRAITRGVGGKGDICVTNSVHQPYSNPVPGSKFLSVQLWSERETPGLRYLSTWEFFAYADFIIEQENK